MDEKPRRRWPLILGLVFGVLLMAAAILHFRPWRPAPNYDDWERLYYASEPLYRGATPEMVREIIGNPDSVAIEYEGRGEHWRYYRGFFREPWEVWFYDGYVSGISTPLEDDR